jgi:hypothetical protein
MRKYNDVLSFDTRFVFVAKQQNVLKFGFFSSHRIDGKDSARIYKGSLVAHKQTLFSAKAKASCRI